MIRCARMSLILWLLAVVCLCKGLMAQSPSQPGLEAIRVFFDEKDVDKVVTPAFIMVSMEELDKRLKEYVQKRSLSAVQDNGIQRATYVARWNEQTLLSRASLLEVAASSAATPLDIGRISMALEEPQGVPEQALPLVRQLRYLDDNHLQILCEPNQSEFWFGFKAKTRRRESGQHSIDLQLPQSVLSMMLVAVPTHAVMTSNLPCAAVTDISKYLPERWPSTALPSLNADEQWFVVWLSGQETCTLNFSPATKVKGAAYRMLVGSAQSDSQVTPAGIQVSSQFRLATAPPGGKLRLQIEEPLHVRKITVGANEVGSWKTIYDEPQLESDGANGAARPRSRLIEFACESSESGPLVVTVDCIGRMPLPYEGALPRVEVDGAYVLDGRCTLLGHERVQVEDARSTAHVLATSIQSGLAQWQWQWTGKSPSTSVRLRPAPHQWSVRALTRLDVQSDVVVASVNASIASPHVQGNQATLKLAEGWFVDSVDLENAPPGVTVVASGDASERIIRWDERRQDLDVRVLLKAHYHQRTDVESLKLTSTRILSLPGADQIDTYVLESSGSFRLELDSELLRMRVREDDLVPWQRALLPRLADAWIFSAGHASLPAIRLNRTRATLEAKLHTTVTEDFNQVMASYRVLCKPISGSIKQLKIQMSLPPGAGTPTWSIADPFVVKSRGKLTATSSVTNSPAGDTAFTIDGETTFTIDLSEEVAEEFQLQAELMLGKRGVKDGSTTAAIGVPLPRMRQAVSQEAVLVVPQRYRLPTLPSMEVLPPGLCCDAGKLVESSLDSEVVAVRYDTSAFAKIDLLPESSAGNGGWVQTQLHEHWQYRAGRTLHRSTWEMASPSTQRLVIHIPPSWEYQSLTINDEEGSAIPNAFAEQTSAERTHIGALSEGHAGQVATKVSKWQTLVATVPKGERVRLQMICSSFDARAWYQPLVYEHPQLPLAALESQSVVWFPKSRWATPGWPTATDGWQERFCPRQWWRLLSFQPGTTGTELDRPVALQPSDDSFPEFERASHKIVAKNGWWKLDFDDPAPTLRVWAIDQSLAGAIGLCVFVLLCIVISMACATHWLRWLAVWMAVGAALAWVPTTALLFVQMFALALIASTLARVARFTAARSRAAAVKRHDSMQLSKSLLPRASVVSLWLVIASSWALSNASAQPFKNGLKEKREVFPILIPVDDNYKVAGEHVYISPRFYGLLKNSDQGENKLREVRVGNAIYSLSISNDLVNSTNTVGDLTVELNVQATLADAELRLPFARSEAALVRAVLDSQSLVLGDRIRQDSDGIIWRASDSDRHTLRIILRPRSLTQREGRGQLSLAIPAIPSARLEVQSDNLSDLREVVVDAVGGVQSETFRTLSARLGPINRLNVSWPLSANRTGPTQVQSDTWIHSRGDKVMAMCQLRMRGASSSTAALSIAGDSNWIPIGQDWEDFRMIATEDASPLGKPLYNVEKIENGSSDELTLRVLMLPKDESAASLTIPFLSMQPFVSASRTLAFSYTDSPKWKTVGTDWQPLFASQAAQLWDGSRLAEQPTLWRVPAGTVQGSLQRIAASALPTVDEVTEVQLQMPESKVKYVARWNAPLIGQPTVRFQIPNSLRLEHVLAGAIKARYSIHRLPGSSTNSELIVFVDSSLGGIESLSLQFSSATRLNRAFRIPRPLLMESEVRSSVVQIFRGVELTSSHAVVDGSALELENLEVRDSQLLQELQAPVGRLELGDRLRSSPDLPLEFTLMRAPSTRTGQSVLRLTRSDQGWRGQLDAKVEIKSGEFNHLFFDMPRSLEGSLKEPLESNVAMTFWPSPDSNRMLLSVLPARGSADQTQISFAFRLPGSSVSQTINVPDIRMLGVSAPRPALALPVELAGEAVRWTGIGRPLAANWLKSIDAKRLDLTAFELFEPLDNQSQATWHSREQREKDAQVLLTCIELADEKDRKSASLSYSSTARSRLGAVSYWLEPHDRPFIDFDLPATCQLVGLEANDRPSNWLKISDSRVRVLLQPSYLPSRLRLSVRWSDVPSSSLTTDMELPTPIASESGPVLVRQPLPQASDTVADYGYGVRIADARELSPEEVESLQAKVWANTLTRSAPVAAGRGGDEMAAWLPSWDPQWLGLNNSSTVTVRRQALSSRNKASGEDANEEVELSVAEFWTEFLEQHGQEGYALYDENSAIGRPWSLEKLRKADEFKWQQVQSDEGQHLKKLTVQTGAVRGDTDLLARALVGLAWILAMLAVGVFSSGSARGMLLALGESIWPLWFVLALAAAALLPMLWPALVVAFGMFIVLVRRYRQMRRDRQFVLMPKVMR